MRIPYVTGNRDDSHGIAHEVLALVEVTSPCSSDQSQ